MRERIVQTLVYGAVPTDRAAQLADGNRALHIAAGRGLTHVGDPARAAVPVPLRPSGRVHGRAELPAAARALLREQLRWAQRRPRRHPAARRRSHRSPPRLAPPHEARAARRASSSRPSATEARAPRRGAAACALARHAGARRAASSVSATPMAAAPGPLPGVVGLRRPTRRSRRRSEVRAHAGRTTECVRQRVRRPLRNCNDVSSCLLSGLGPIAGILSRGDGPQGGV